MKNSQSDQVHLVPENVSGFGCKWVENVVNNVIRLQVWSLSLEQRAGGGWRGLDKWGIWEGSGGWGPPVHPHTVCTSSRDAGGRERGEKREREG